MNSDNSFLKIGKEIDVCTSRLLSAFTDVTHFVTMRGTYCPENHFSTLNFGRHSGEDLSLVLFRRKSFCNALGITEKKLIQPRQIHGTSVLPISNEFLSWQESQQNNYLAHADGLVTDVHGICIAVSTADCVPLLCYDPIRRVVSATHAGWRGTVGHIVSRTIELMRDDYDCRPSDIRAFIGPSIGPDAFEVGDEVVQFFADAYPQDIHHKIILPRKINSGKHYIDLWQVNRYELLSSGLLPEHIDVSGICTYTQHHLFFSSRRAAGNPFGRFLSGIMMQ